MIEYIVVGLAFVLFLAVVGVVAIAGIARLARRPKAAPQPHLFAGVAPAPAPPAAPSADFLGLAMAYNERRDAEEKVLKMKKALDGIAYWAGKLPAGDAPAAPKE